MLIRIEAAFAVLLLAASFALAQPAEAAPVLVQEGSFTAPINVV